MKNKPAFRSFLYIFQMHFFFFLFAFFLGSLLDDRNIFLKTLLCYTHHNSQQKFKHIFYFRDVKQKQYLSKSLWGLNALHFT